MLQLGPLADEIQAVIAENATLRARVPDSPAARWLHRLIDEQTELLQRLLDDPVHVHPDELTAMVFEVEAAGRWRIARYGVDAAAGERARRLHLLARIREWCCRASGTQHVMRIRIGSPNPAIWANLGSTSLAQSPRLAHYAKRGNAPSWPTITMVAVDTFNRAEAKRRGSNLRKGRRELGINQTEFGRRLSIELGRPLPMPAAEISRYEVGRRNPGPRTRLAMAKVLNKPLSFFDQESESA